MSWSSSRAGRSLGAIAACFSVAAFADCGGSDSAEGKSETVGTSAGGIGGGQTSSSGGATSSTGGTGSGSAGMAGANGSTTGGGTVGDSTGTASTNGGGITGGSTATNASTGTTGMRDTSTGNTSDTGGTTGTSGSRGTGGTSTNGGISGTSTNGGITGTGGTTGTSGSVVDAGGSSCPPSTALTGGKQYCSNSKGNAGGNYAYELWSNGTGSGCMTVYGVDANFSATWTNAGDFLARIGLQFDETKTPAQIGTISSDFAETKTGNTGLVYVGIYGWSVSPLREYYIIDDWGTSKPADMASDGTPRTKVGTITVDGDTYDVWKHTQTNKPAITGNNQTFDQYFSVRQTARSCGHISISEHFSQWANLGLQLGKLEEAKLLLEAQNSTGTIAFTKATVTVQ